MEQSDCKNWEIERCGEYDRVKSECGCFSCTGRFAVIGRGAEVDEAEYSIWLEGKGVPGEHLKAHNFALRLFQDNGGLSASAMREVIEGERHRGADSSRVRNLQAAAKYIRLYVDQREPELELDDSSFGGRERLSEQSSRSEQDIRLLDLGFDEPAQRAPQSQRTIGVSPSGAALMPQGIGENSLGQGACDCSPESKAVAMTTSLMFAGPSITVLYLVVRVVAGKSFVAMANWGVFAILAISALLLLRMKCDRCEEVLEASTLPAGDKRSFLWLRIVLSVIAILFTVLTVRSYRVWAEDRRIENLSSEEYEAELMEDYKREVEAELGHELSDSEFEAYLEEDEAAERLEAEEFFGRPITDEEWDDL